MNHCTSEAFIFMTDRITVRVDFGRSEIKRFRAVHQQRRVARKKTVQRQCYEVHKHIVETQINLRCYALLHLEGGLCKGESVGDVESEIGGSRFPAMRISHQVLDDAIIFASSSAAHVLHVKREVVQEIVVEGREKTAIGTNLDKTGVILVPIVIDHVNHDVLDFGCAECVVVVRDDGIAVHPIDDDGHGFGREGSVAVLKRKDQCRVDIRAELPGIGQEEEGGIENDQSRGRKRNDGAHGGRVQRALLRKGHQPHFGGIALEQIGMGIDVEIVQRDGQRRHPIHRNVNTLYISSERKGNGNADGGKRGRNGTCRVVENLRRRKDMIVEGHSVHLASPARRSKAQRAQSGPVELRGGVPASELNRVPLVTAILRSIYIPLFLTSLDRTHLVERTVTAEFSRNHHMNVLRAGAEIDEFMRLDRLFLLLHKQMSLVPQQKHREHGMLLFLCILGINGKRHAYDIVSGIVLHPKLDTKLSRLHNAVLEILEGPLTLKRAKHFHEFALVPVAVETAKGILLDEISKGKTVNVIVGGEHSAVALVLCEAVLEEKMSLIPVGVPQGRNHRNKE